MRLPTILLSVIVAITALAVMAVAHAADNKVIEIPALPGGTTIYYLLPSVVLKDHDITLVIAEPWPDEDSCMKAGAEMRKDWEKDDDVDLDLSDWICVERLIHSKKAPPAPAARPAKKNET